MLFSARSGEVMVEQKQPVSSMEQASQEWYDLFSRGARDWLRHNEKIQEAVKKKIPDLLTGADLITGGGQKKVQIPVKMLEHYRFRLDQTRPSEGIGQGNVQPGDILRPAQHRFPGQGKGGSGDGEGGPEFVVEVEVNDIVDWLWEELELPNLQPKSGASQEDEYIREGLEKHGVRARLDRRQTLKQAIRRRIVQPDGPAFSNDDLRYRQLVFKPRPTTQAVVLFGLDASSSMVEQDRKLAKAFFFWALQGLRRQYNRIETVFIAHTTTAWEFTEEEFFQVTAQGGTVASTAFDMALEAIKEKYPPEQYNIYLFYASDGENYPEDRQPAMDALVKLGRVAQYIGYVQTSRSPFAGKDSETITLFSILANQKVPCGSYVISDEKDVWSAIRSFFHQQAGE